MLDVHIKRREFVKRAVYAVPAILTLKAMPSFASAGSARTLYGAAVVWKTQLKGRPCHHRPLLCGRERVRSFVERAEHRTLTLPGSAARNLLLASLNLSLSSRYRIQ